MSDERFLVTGAFGCIGTWVVCDLVRAGVAVTALDLGGEPARWPLAMSDDEIGRVRRRQGDITDLEQVERVLDEDGITHVIHLAALQVPFCRADPPLGARVNVLGTVICGPRSARSTRHLHRVDRARSAVLRLRSGRRHFA